MHRLGEVGRCSLTGATIANDAMGPNGRAAAFDWLVNQREERAEPLEDRRLKDLRQSFLGTDVKPSRAWILAGPNPKIVAVLIEQRRALGLRRPLLKRCFMDAELQREIVNP